MEVRVTFRPAADVISYGINCITSREGSLDDLFHRIHITESCVDVVRRIIGTLSLDKFTLPIVLGVIHHATMEGREALVMYRTLSSMYADLVEGIGAAYVDVESVDAHASPSADDSGGAEVTGTASHSDVESAPLVQRRIHKEAYALGRRDDRVHLSRTSLLAVWKEVDNVILSFRLYVPIPRRH